MLSAVILPVAATCWLSPQTDAAPRHALVESQIPFAQDFLREACAQPGNQLFSPFSIHTALAMAAEGARGETAAELEKVLRLKPGSAAPRFSKLATELDAPHRVDRGRETRERAYTLAAPNALFVHQGLELETPFRNTLQNAFHAEPHRVDFGKPDAARAAIHKWIEKATFSKIRTILTPDLPTPDTRLVLANAVYLKAAWWQPFEKSFSQDGRFRVSAKSDVKATFMRESRELEYLETPLAHVVSIPYEQQALSMVVVLPKEAHALAQLLASESMEKWLARGEECRVNLQLPRFQLSATTDLKEPLQRLGVKAAFDSEKADFSGMTKQERLFIGFALHKATIHVDEEGTEASAATVVGMLKSAVSSRPPVQFVADHPFLFFLRHERTGLVLFAGRVADPATTGE